MCITIRVSVALAAVLVAASGASGEAQQPIRRERPDSLPALSWAPLYFRSFDAAARAAGWEPLRRVPSSAGRREVRIWTQVEIGVPKNVHRFVDEGGRVTGELVHYWSAPTPTASSDERPGETMHDLMVYSLRGRCDGFAVAEETGICRARFTRAPDWGAALRAAESSGLWTIPDPSTLPPDGVHTLDGWTIVVELRDASGYRTYRYNSPEAHPAWPSAAQAREVARALQAIDSLVAPNEVDRVHRGVTTGRYESAFQPCEGGAAWEFKDDLRSLAAGAAPALRAVLPDSGDGGVDSAATAPLYYVEVFGQLSPEWLARQWRSRFPRVLQPFELRDVRRWTGAECGTR